MLVVTVNERKRLRSILWLVHHAYILKKNFSKNQQKNWDLNVFLIQLKCVIFIVQIPSYKIKTCVMWQIVRRKPDVNDLLARHPFIFYTIKYQKHPQRAVFCAHNYVISQNEDWKNSLCIELYFTVHLSVITSI